MTIVQQSRWCRWLPLLLTLGACQLLRPPQPEVQVSPPQEKSYDETGIASWYGVNFQGKKTTSGEIFDENKLTAAHRTLPMPSLVRVTNLENGRSAIIRINDRGPYNRSRIIDLSRKSARELGIHSTARVRVQLLKEEADQDLASVQDKGKKADDKASVPADPKDKETAP